MNEKGNEMKSQQIKNKVYLAQEYLEKANQLIISAFAENKESLAIEYSIYEIIDRLDTHVAEVCATLYAEDFPSE
jgi:hypothetical protein